MRGLLPNHDDDLFTVAHLLHHTTQLRSLTILALLFARPCNSSREVKACSFYFAFDAYLGQIRNLNLIPATRPCLGSPTYCGPVFCTAS